MRRGFSASVIVRPPTFYPQPLARDVPQQSLTTHHTLRVKVYIIIRVVYAITHGVDHAWWDGPFLVHATARGVNHFWCELKVGHPISRSVHQRWSIPPGVVHSHQGEVSGKSVTEPSWRAARKTPVAAPWIRSWFLTLGPTVDSGRVQGPSYSGSYQNSSFRPP